MVRNTEDNNKDIKKGLYLVPSPIGNLGDITLRAIDTLKKSDYILCEDTRVSKILLKKYNIKSKLISNHKFNEKKNSFNILEFLSKGCVISLISDAGTPSISDPGRVLINECIKNNIKYIVLQKPLVNWLRHKNQWSNNPKLILKGVVRFHKKYLTNMDLITKVRHYKKIIYYFFLSRIY